MTTPKPQQKITPVRKPVFSPSSSSTSSSPVFSSASSVPRKANFKNKKFTFEDRIKQDILLLMVSDDFMLDIENINKKYSLPLKKDTRDIDEEGKPLIIDNQNFIDDGQKIMEKYRLPESHGFTFSSFLLNGHLNFNLPSDFWHLNPYVVSNDTKTCITLKIYPDTTLKDIQNNWFRIKSARDNLLNKDISRKVRIENLDRDIEILNLKRSGKSSKEIEILINKDKRFKNTILGYEDIPKIIQRLKNMAKRNMARKKS